MIVERRVGHRATARQKIHARLAETPLELTLLDLSISGCKARSRNLALAQGASITLVLSESERIPGKVIWCDAGVAGIHFDRALDLESFVRLVQRGVAQARSDATLRDAFGRRLPDLSSNKAAKAKPGDKRREIRRELKREAVLRLGFQRDLKIMIYNLSANGCLLRHGIEQLAIEDRVAVTLPDFESFSGTVMWNSGHKAGVRFDRSLHPAVVELILTRPPQGQGTGLGEDRAGKVSLLI